MSEDSARLVRMFRAFVVEFRDESPVYEQLSWQPEPFAYRPGYSVGSTAH